MHIDDISSLTYDSPLCCPCARMLVLYQLTPLMRAAGLAKSPQMVEMLLEANADVNAVDMVCVYVGYQGVGVMLLREIRKLAMVRRSTNVKLVV